MIPLTHRRSRKGMAKMTGKKWGEKDLNEENSENQKTELELAQDSETDGVTQPEFTGSLLSADTVLRAGNSWEEQEDTISILRVTV